MRRRSATTVALFSGAAVLLGLFGNLATSKANIPDRLVPWMWAATIVLGLSMVAGAVHEYRHAQHAAVDVPRDLDLARVADQLAVSVRRQWEGEAARRQLNDPYPLPVHWRPADAALFGDWSALVRLATVGPGWPSPHTEVWAADQDGLAGTDRDLVKVLDRVPTGRLVVLGDAGAGKTILLVRLTLDLLSRRSPGQPVPVLLPLATWDPTEEGLFSWIERRLVTEHAALSSTAPARAASQARALLEVGLILPVLDGLDEISVAVRGSAITRINDALRPGQRLVLAARTAAHPHTEVEPRVAGAAGILVCPLDTNAVVAYLKDSAGGSTGAARWDDFVSILRTDRHAPVAQALTTPLMAALVRAVYNPRPGEELSGVTHHPGELLDLHRFPTVEAIQRHLFDQFIPAAYRPYPDGSRQPRWNAEQAERWLIFLARDLQHRLGGKTDIAWWLIRGAAPRPLPWLTVATVAGLTSLVTPVVGTGSGVGIIAALLTGLLVRYLSRSRAQPAGTGLAKGFVGGILGGLLGAVLPMVVLRPGIGLAGGIAGGGIFVGIVVAPFGRYVVCFAGGFVGEIALAFYEHTAAFAGIKATLGLPGLHVLNAVGLGLAVGLAVGLAGRTTPARALRWSPFGLASGIVTAMIIGMVVGTQTGLVTGLIVGGALTIPAGYAGAMMFEAAAETNPKTVASPTTVLKRDRATFRASFLGLGLALGCGSGVALGFSSTNGHVNGLKVGLGIGITDLVAVGLTFAFIQASWGPFALARWWLAASRKLPWRLMTFLTDAHINHGVLRQAGAVYQFRHIELQRRLAAREAPASQPVASTDGHPTS